LAGYAGYFKKREVGYRALHYFVFGIEKSVTLFAS
jgi:hypothetical protein